MINELKVDLIPAIKKLSVYTKKSSASSLSGGYRSIFKGRGLEFDHYREYSGMDDAKLIDWKATLRSSVPLIKVFTEERNMDVLFVFDVSESMIFTSTEKLKCEYGIELVSSLSYAILKSEDNVGLAMFADKIVNIVPPAPGNKQFYRIKKLLTDTSMYGGGFSLGEPMKFISGYLKRGGVIIIVSDFIGLEKDWEKFLKIAATKFDVIGMMIRDPRDDELPPEVGDVVIQDPYSNQKLLINTAKEAKKYKKFNEEYKKYIKKTFNDMGADLLEIDTTQPFVQQIMGFFEKREKMLR